MYVNRLSIVTDRYGRNNEKSNYAKITVNPTETTTTIEPIQQEQRHTHKYRSISPFLRIFFYARLIDKTISTKNYIRVVLVGSCDGACVFVSNMSLYARLHFRMDTFI